MRGRSFHEVIPLFIWLVVPLRFHHPQDLEGLEGSGAGDPMSASQCSRYGEFLTSVLAGQLIDAKVPPFSFEASPLVALNASDYPSSVKWLRARKGDRHVAMPRFCPDDLEGNRATKLLPVFFEGFFVFNICCVIFFPC